MLGWQPLACPRMRPPKTRTLTRLLPSWSDLYTNIPKVATLNSARSMGNQSGHLGYEDGCTPVGDGTDGRWMQARSIRRIALLDMIATFPASGRSLQRWKMYDLSADRLVPLWPHCWKPAANNVKLKAATCVGLDNGTARLGVMPTAMVDGLATARVLEVAKRRV